MMNKRAPSPTTLPHLLCERADRTPDAVAFWRKRKGVWHATTWQAYRDQVRDCATGLKQMGFATGDRLLLVGEASPEWLVAELAAQWLGGVSVTPYPDGCADDIAKAVERTQPRFALTDTIDHKRHFDRASVETIWLRREPGMTGGTVDTLIQSGRDQAQATPLQPSEPATIAFTAGAGGEARPVSLTHQAIISTAERVLDVLGNRSGVDALCQVPFAHVSERVCTAAAHLLAGGKLYFVERVDTVSIDLADIHPAQVSALAWQWDRLAQDLILKMQDASRPNRAGFERLTAGQSGGVGAMLMRRALRRHLGLHKVEKLVCHGGSLRPETERLFAALHLSMITSYGVTELCGWSLVKEGTGSWRASPGQGYQLAGDGELLLSMGQSLSATGDIASDGGGQVQLLGRKTGTRKPDGALAQRIERDLALCRYVSHAAVWRRGAGWDVVVCLDAQTTGDWARRQGHSYTSFHSLAENGAVQDFIRSHVAAIVDIHAGRSASTTVHILNEPLRREDGALTATGSLRRPVIERIYGETVSQAGRELSNAVSG